MAMFLKGELMENRIPPMLMNSPTRVHGSLRRSSSLPSDQERYLEELLAERQKLGPFIQITPACGMLINREITRMANLLSDQGLLHYERNVHEYPFRAQGHQQLNGGPMDLAGWSAMQTKESGFQGMAPLQAPVMGWNGIQTTPTVRRVVRLDVPIDKYPNYNFIGRLLGPHGNSLKRFESMTGCQVYIRGGGSVKDSAKELILEDKVGYEHLSEPLYLLIEAEFPEDIVDVRMDHIVSSLEEFLKPVDDIMDPHEQEQLGELAMLNGTPREERPSMSPSMSPFNSTCLKPAKTGDDI